MDFQRLVERIKLEEGFTPIAFWDNDQATWGYGTKAPAIGARIDEPSAAKLLEERVLYAESDVRKVFPSFDSMTEARQESLVDMAFNLGLTKMNHFIRMISAIHRGDWLGASIAAENSLWYTQVKNRAKRVVEELRSGEFQSDERKT